MLMLPTPLAVWDYEENNQWVIDFEVGDDIIVFTQWKEVW